jgi:chromosome segregation ATPase
MTQQARTQQERDVLIAGLAIERENLGNHNKQISDLAEPRSQAEHDHNQFSETIEQFQVTIVTQANHIARLETQWNELTAFINTLRQDKGGIEEFWMLVTGSSIWPRTTGT